MTISQTAPKNINEKDNDSRTPLHHAKTKQETISLLNQGADIDCIDEDGWSPLMIAASSNNIEKSSILIQNNANLNIQNSFGNTALHYAVSKNYTPIVKLLIDAGALLLKNEVGQTPVHRAAVRGWLDALILLGKESINVTDNQGNTALHLTAEESEIGAMEYLIEIGADKSIRNRDGKLAVDLVK